MHFPDKHPPLIWVGPLFLAFFIAGMLTVRGYKLVEAAPVRKEFGQCISLPAASGQELQIGGRVGHCSIPSLASALPIAVGQYLQNPGR